MANRKNRTIPVALTLIAIMIIVSFFVNIKQTIVVCEKTKRFDKNVLLAERIISKIDGKKINELQITKTIFLTNKYSEKENIKRIKESLKRTLDYLGDKVKYTISGDEIIIQITVSKNEIILLDNTSFNFNNDLEILIDSNTKSKDVIALTVGDNYTDGEFMKYMKSRGYSCK